MFAIGLVYAGFMVVLLGCVSLARPLRVIRIQSRRRAAAVLALGLALALTGTALPASITRVAVPRTQLDRFIPAYQFHELHTLRVAAPRDRGYQAMKQVTANEILLFRTLTSIRRLGRPGPESILDSPEHLPLLEVATRTSFLLLAEEPGHEIVIGTVVLAPPGWRAKADPTPKDFQDLHAPGFALAAMNFRLEHAGPGGCVVSTETRVYATDAAACRRFAAYWRVIYPGSALIRRMWLQAIKRRTG